MITFKNRVIDYSKPVEVYRCLNRKGFIFSVRQNNFVVAHTANFVLKDCEFIINEFGKQKSIETQQRNVHAFIRGFIGSIDDIKTSFSYYLTYNPFSKNNFLVNDSEITKSQIVYTQENKILVQI